MTRYAEHYSKRETPQNEQADSRQAANHAGGYAFVVDDWTRLERFLILGADGGTYYVAERKLVRENAACVERCLEADHRRTVETIATISESGRAPKNDPAIFAIALAASVASPADRRVALAALARVCRTGTHLFQFVRSVEAMRGWGRSLRAAIGRWYTERPVDALAHQLLKYQQREGVSHRDVLRLAHPRPSSAEQHALLRYAVAGRDALGARKVTGSQKAGRRDREYGATEAALPRVVEGFERLRTEKHAPSAAAALVREYGLTHEMVPSELLAHAEVWGALLEHMPMTAMIRNLGRMSANGLLAPLSAAAELVVSRLSDRERIRKARVHPMAVLFAARTYAAGHGLRGSLAWTPVSTVVDALDAAFYLAFDNVQPTGKATLLALDVSGSMMAPIAGTPLTCREASAAMAMVTARAEPNHQIVGFAAGRGGGYGGMLGGGSSQLVPVPITARSTLVEACAAMTRIPFGGTDCSLPMRWALEQGIGVDAFHVYTDSETWAGPVHPHQALVRYRQTTGRAAKLIVVGMTATQFTIADPSDAGMLDVTGFDTAAPALIADFVRGLASGAAL